MFALPKVVQVANSQQWSSGRVVEWSHIRPVFVSDPYRTRLIRGHSVVRTSLCPGHHKGQWSKKL